MRTFHTSEGLAFGLYDSWASQPLVKLFKANGELTDPRFNSHGDLFLTNIGVYRTSDAQLVINAAGFAPTWSPDSRFAIFQSVYGASAAGATVYDIEAGSLANELPGLPGHPNGYAAWSKDSAQLITWFEQGKFTLWDVETWTPLATLDAHLDPARKVAFSPDSGLLAASDLYGTVRIWDTMTGQLRHTLRAHESDLTRLEWSPGGRLLATATGRLPVGATLAADSHTAYLWDGETGALVATRQHPDNLTDIEWSPDGRYFATGSNQKIMVWDARTEAVVFEQPPGTQYYALLSWSPDSTMIVADIGGISHGGFNIRVWNVPTGRNLTGRLTGVGLNRYFWTADSRYLLGMGTRCTDAYPSRNCQIIVQHLMDRTSPTPDRQLRLDPLPGYEFGTFMELPGLFLSTAGDRLLALDGAEATLWSLDHQAATRLGRHTDVVGAYWSPDGRYVALLRAILTVEVIDSATNRRVLLVENATAPSWRLEETELRFFTREPDPSHPSQLGRTLAWDLATGEHRASPQWIRPVYSPDGRLIADTYGGALRLLAPE